VLDIGCGSGLLLNMIAALGVEFQGVGIDVSRRAIEAATAATRHASQWKAKLAFYEFRKMEDARNEPFDVVFLIDVMHHIPPTDQFEFFDWAISQVRNGGILVYKDMCCRPWWRAQANRLHDLLVARELVTHVPIKRVEDWARSRGLDITHREDIYRFWYGHELMVAQRPL
jgi:2-polyprenyl-3-methyl-5-hydroxy-6-metoxy-1,4-benzoquinol methylase